MVAQEYPVSRVCAVLECAHSTSSHQRVEPDEQAMRRAVEEVAAASPRYGYRCITHQLRRQGQVINHKRVQRIMSELGLHARRKSPRKVTTNSTHAYPRYPNLVEHLMVSRPEQVWVCAITYIRLHQEFVYLAVIMDVYTRCIHGWQLGRGLDQSLTLQALECALRHGTLEIHHSDQGVQYAATAQISMAEVVAAWQNG